jgi:hypothetical protein
MRTRNCQLKINLTLEEMASFDKSRGKVRRSIAGRYLVTGAPMPKVVPAINSETATELNRIGTNLNQIARLFNEKYPGNSEFEATRSLLKKLREKLNEM